MMDDCNDDEAVTASLLECPFETPLCVPLLVPSAAPFDVPLLQCCCFNACLSAEAEEFNDVDGDDVEPLLVLVVPLEH
jgi:hypothetical protein